MPRTKSYPVVLKNRYGKVSIYRSTNAGYDQYRITWYEGRVRKREATSDEAKAYRRANEILADLTAGVSSRDSGTGEEWAYYRKCVEMLDGVPLMEAVRFYLQRHDGGAPLTDAPVEDLIEQCIGAKELQGCSAAHVAQLRRTLTAMAAEIRKPLRMITPSDLDKWLSKVAAPKTRLNRRADLNTFFSWAQSKGHLPATERHAAQRTDRPKLNPSEPGILTPAQLERLLGAAVEHNPSLIFFFACGAFTAVRTSEIMRLTDAAITDSHIVLSSAITKTRRRRLVEIPEVLAAWIAEHRKLNPGGPLVPKRPLRAAKKLRDLVKFDDWPHNALRHSGVSYMLAREKNAATVAETAGHSIAMLQTHYKALVTPEQAEEWFSIFPEQ